MTSSSDIRVALLYQAIEPPAVNGVKKPMKPGGYKDSCADIAYCLSTSPSPSTSDYRVSVVTPTSNPNVYKDSEYAWCFPDTEAGILDAIAAGATHLWANTILFASHPLQTSAALDKFAKDVKVIGQPPLQVEMFDDKALVNDMLRRQRHEDGNSAFTMPKGWTLCDPATVSDDTYAHEGSDKDQTSLLRKYLESLSLPYPVVGKPVRGRGSHGVKVCHSLNEMVSHATTLFSEAPRIMVEEYLAGEEGTVTVMPVSGSASRSQNGESKQKGRYTALPVVRRTNHHDGIAPYNGTVAVSANSRAVTAAEAALDPAYAQVRRECERVAELLQPIGPIRIDVRRRRRAGLSDTATAAGSDADEAEKFCLFDLNVKPNMTGPGRPGREDQACLSLIAAQELGWDYNRLLHELLATAVPLDELRRCEPLEL